MSVYVNTFIFMIEKDYLAKCFICQLQALPSICHYFCGIPCSNAQIATGKRKYLGSAACSSQQGESQLET